MTRLGGWPRSRPGASVLSARTEDVRPAACFNPNPPKMRRSTAAVPALACLLLLAQCAPRPASPSSIPAGLPRSVRIQVPYTAQAPFGNWDPAHQEYCEAAAVLMAGSYLRGDRRSRIPPEEADQAMARMVAWERVTCFGNDTATT